MIFATVGSMFPFDRLVKAMDEWAGSRNVDDVLVQIGDGAYEPRNVKWVRKLSPSDYTHAIASCELLVAHLGMGSIISAMQARKPMLLLPRRSTLGEINTDHQLHARTWIAGKKGVLVADDGDEMARYLDQFRRGEVMREGGEMDTSASPELIAKVRRFIEL